jgi:2-polyprenyl-3-methyl-5-hydroxy-6-metoxy-1,4-benzoquinol methylase
MSYAKTYFEKFNIGQASSSKPAWFLYNHLQHLPADKDAKILEIGPGFGEIVNLLINTLGFKNTKAVELDTDLAIACNERAPASCVRVDSTTDFLRANNQAFDVVIMLHVLEHIEKKEAVEMISAIKGALRPGGKLLIEVPNSAHPLTGSATRYADFTHVVGYTDSSLRQVLAMGGFDSISINAIGCPGGGARRTLQQIIQKIVNVVIQMLLKPFFGRSGPIISVNIGACAIN